MNSHAIDRRLYRGGRPGRVASLLNGLWARATAAGLAPSQMVTLELRGRRTGRTHRLPVVVARYERERYLVAMLGQRASWVRNVEAAGGDALLHRRSRESVQLEEVPVGDRAPILREYLRVAPGARAHFPVDRRAPLTEFERIAAGYPVFRVRPTSPTPAT